MKKGIIFLLAAMFIFSWAFAEGTKAAHGPTAYVPQAEIGSRAVGDDCTDPIIISIPADLPYEDLAQTTCGRGNSYSETPLGWYDGGEDIIYRLDVTADIFLDFEMIPDVTYTGLLVADDCPDVGAEVAMHTGSALSPRILNGVELLAGNSYYVMIDTWPSPDCITSLDFTIVEGTQVFPPDNDTCETAEVIGEVVDYAFNTTLATTSGVGAHVINQDIWYSYTPASDGTITVDLCGSSFDTKLAIWDACGGTELDYNDDADYCNTRSLQSAILDLPVVSGEDYLIQLGGYSSASGFGDITIVFTPVVSDPPVVLFSEYIEGSTVGAYTNNKALEIWNNSGDVVNLDDFRIAQSSNGGGWEYWHIFPVGATLVDQDVWVILNDGTDPAFFDPLDADEVLSYPSVVHHNGNDARGLEWTPDGGTTWILLDVIGVPDEDPGVGWEVAGVADATKDHTLVRKDAIMAGNTDWALSAGTNADDSEWVVYPDNTWNYLGEHPSSPVTLDPPQNLMVTEDGYATWEAPGGIGGLILDQQPNQSNGVFSDWSYPQILAENFVLTADASISQLVTWGGYFNANVPMDTDYITVIIHADDTGAPGAELYNEADVASVREQTGLVLFGVDEWKHTLTLATPVALTAGTYWIEYYHTTGYPATDTYFWEVGNPDPVGGIVGSAFSLEVPVTAWTLDAEKDFAMQIIGSTDSDAIAFKPVITPAIHVSTTIGTQSHRISRISNVPNITEITRDFLGYNTYLDGVFQVFTADLFYQYTGLASGTTYLAEVTAVYDEGESDPVEYTFTTTGGTNPDPPINVMVDDETGTLSWFPPLMAVIDDNFDSYTSGDYIAEVGADWTTWSNAPGGAEDALVSDAQSYSPSNSINVIADNDLILIMDDYTEGKVVVDLMMYVPTGFCGYYNLQQTSTPGEFWGFQIYFQADGQAFADCAAEAALNFSFNHDEWMACRVVVDLDNDLATYYHDGEWMYEWQWSLGTFGTVQVNQLGGVNIFGGANATQPTDVPNYYIDDVMVSEVSDEVTGFNVYLGGVIEPDSPLGDDVMEYTYTGLIPEQAYIAGVSALYGADESDIIDVDFVYTPDDNFLPPANPTVVVVDYNDVELMWEAPSGAAEWIQWDSGEVGNGIGLTAAGTFYVASHWDPADLTDYDGAVISKVKFYPNDDATFAVKIWSGANAATLESSEDVPTYTVGEFLEVELSNPVTIDASQELWFGYEIIQDLINFPAGGDLGPAIVGYGDMISTNGSTWSSLFELAGYDYNWNLAAYVEEADGSVLVLNKPNRTKKVEARVSVSSVLNRNLFSSIPVEQVRDTRSLAGYKIYQDGVEVGEVPDPATLTYLVESLDAGTYEFTVTAFYTNPDGESVPSAGVNATIVLDYPSNFNAQFQDPNVIVTWSAPARGVDSYNVYRDGELHEEGVSETMFIDINPAPGTYMYSATTVFDGGWESDLCDEIEVIVTGSIGDEVIKPTVTKLTGNYPNPFNPTTTISFSLKEAGHVSVNIYNMRGQLVKTLVNAELERDFHEIVWDGRDNSGKTTTSGVYFYKMKAQNYNSTKKMILMK